MIKRCASYLPVADVARVGDYYGTVLGFACEYVAGSPEEFAIYARDAATIMLRRVPDPTLIVPNEPQGGAWDVFCWVENADALFEELTARGAIIVSPPTVQPYGMKEFAVRDPVGHVIGFGQSL